MNRPYYGDNQQILADAGRWNSEVHESRSCPVNQLITVGHLLAGEVPDLPRWGLSNFKYPTCYKRGDEHPQLFSKGHEPNK